MFRKTVIALAVSAAAAALAAAPVLAYGPTTGASGSTSTTSPVPGAPFTFTATFTVAGTSTPESGNSVTFSSSGPCAVSFNPASATTDVNGTVTTQATVASGCAAGSVLALTALNTTTGQFFTTSVTVAGLPVASGSPQPAPAAPIALILLLAGALAAGAALSLRLVRR